MRRPIAPVLLLALPIALGGCAYFRSKPPTYVVFFDQGAVTLDDPARSAVADAARGANAAPSLPVTISSYIGATAGPGSTEVARAQQRTEAVASQLVADGVRAGRLRRVPPSPDQDTPGGVASRRVEIDVKP